jgi:hypothetical protein
MADSSELAAIRAENVRLIALLESKHPATKHNPKHNHVHW